MIRTADVVIVGGGVTGVSIAFSLAARGVRNILVLERRFLASGGTGRSVGIVRQLYPTAETTQMVVRSLRVFQQLRRGRPAVTPPTWPAGASSASAPAMR